RGSPAPGWMGRPRRGGSAWPSRPGSLQTATGPKAGGRPAVARALHLLGAGTRLVRMQVAVVNGVNLNMLGRRDPEQYGALTLTQLETQIYAWATDLGLTVRCFQTNHEGQLVEQIHDACDWAGGM